MGLLVVDEVVVRIVGRAVSLGADAFAVQRLILHDAIEEGACGGDPFGRAGAFVDQLGQDTQGLAVDQDGIALLDPRAQRWLVAIDADPAFLDQRIGLAPGTEAGVGDEFVDTHRHRSIAAVKGMQGDVENQLAFRGISAR